MGTNNLQTKNPGDVISSDDPNQYKTASTVNFVPRNSSGVPTDEGGTMGTTSYRWSVGYFTQLVVGVIASGLKIVENSGKLAFQVNSTEIITIDETEGINLPVNKMVTLTGSGTWDVPNGLASEVIWIKGWGGGGGGGGTSAGNNGGGGGGQGSVGRLIAVNLEGAAQITYSAGAGGTGGNTAGGDGSGGASTSIGVNGKGYVFYGGLGGKGTTTGTGGAGGSTIWQVATLLSFGGTGANYSGGSGANGAFSSDVNGGTGGAQNNSYGGGGGGGAGNYINGENGAGGNGGNGDFDGSDAPGTNTGAGGGGGGGNGQFGGDGANGAVQIFWLDNKTPV